jgi:TolB protein
MVVLDGDSVELPGNSTSVTLEGVEAGAHEVKLAGVAPNCAVSGANPERVTVAPDTMADLTFAVECSATGTLEIFSTTTGLSLDPDGYRVEVDGTAGRPIGRSASILVSSLGGGSHILRLIGIAANCTVVGLNPLPAVVITGGTGVARFDVVCVRPPGPGTGQLLFTSDRSGTPEIYRMNEDGSAIVDLTPNAQAVAGRWSPDGSKIVFTSIRDGNSEIYVMEADASHPVRLTRTPEHETDPVWSPNGTRIAYAAGGQVWIMNADGSGATPLTEGAEPSWSPDETRIAFARRSSQYDPLAERYANDIYTIALDGSALRNRTNTTSGFVSFAAPAWSPDGTRIAAWQRAPGRTFPSYVNNVVVIGADGGLLVLTGPAVYPSAPVWSPDGAAIAFATREASVPPEIRMIAISGGAALTLAPSPGFDLPTSWR